MIGSPRQYVQFAYGASEAVVKQEVKLSQM